MQDFSKHNEEARQVWEAYHKGRPIRAPMLLTSVQRIWVLDPSLNTTGHHLEAVPERSTHDVRGQPSPPLSTSRFHIPQDAEMGIPAESWKVALEFGNVVEEAWFGCEIIYPEDQIATTRPRYAGDAREELLREGPPGSIRRVYGQDPRGLRRNPRHGGGLLNFTAARCASTRPSPPPPMAR